jgi:hypothetical protein
LSGKSRTANNATVMSVLMNMVNQISTATQTVTFKRTLTLFTRKVAAFTIIFSLNGDLIVLLRTLIIAKKFVVLK